MTTYLSRKLLGCTYPGCPTKPLSDHCMCERHRDEHRRRNRQWWNARRAQLSFVQFVSPA